MAFIQAALLEKVRLIDKHLSMSLGGRERERKGNIRVEVAKARERLSELEDDLETLTRE